MLQAASIAALPGIRHAFFTRNGGVSQGVYDSLNGGVGSNDTPEHVAENRARMALALGVKPERFLTAYQIHSPDVVVVDEPWSADNRPRVDALVTRVPDLAIGVSTADCGPLLFADSNARVIGAAHAGWRGAFTGIIESTIAAMEKLGAARDNIAVALGPTIRQANYEVGPEFVARFLAADIDNTRFFTETEREGHALFDLTGYIASRVEQAGITDFEDLGLCTYAEADRFFSFRRTTHLGEPDYGRHINAIALHD
ncbi:peptidoglycan editing factor PgeF [Undibacter mobilis]|uniref:Purine nucleoside phosphorylase n=1 Tax=Undibacter mobilis TaxID=2292256 RepID=A0A371BB25_9BRAD|nr:peptidoglycan editing factor PgeF [Undibacter mobilis]RDV04806.1 peptidoglycan editing factor PgeF [Undibacter mobilis]